MADYDNSRYTYTQVLAGTIQQRFSAKSLPVTGF